MDNVVFSRADHTVTGLNRPAGPAEYNLDLPYPIAAVKTLQRVNGEKQKTNSEGQLLYYSKPTLEEDGSETVNEVTTARIATAWEEVAQEYTLVTEDGNVPMSSTNQVAIAWDELEPVMIPNVESYQVEFTEQPSLFLYEELRAAKMASIKQANAGKELVYYDEEFDAAGFSTEIATHAANLGDGIMAIHPGGSCRTVKLQLGKPASKIQVYLEAQPDIKVEIGATAAEFVEVIDGNAQLAEPAAEVYVRFTNTAENYREVYAFGILI